MKPTLGGPELAALAPVGISPERLLEIATGYQRARTLFAVVELDVCTRLEGRSATAAELGEELDVHPLAADRFLNACTALGLLERRGDRYSNSAEASLFLVRGRETALNDALRRYDRSSYPAWIGLVERLHAWRPGAGECQTPMSEDQGPEALRAQHGLALLTGEALARSFPFAGHRRMLDLGGGTGAMSIAICRLHPHLRSTLLESPGMAESAREAVAAGLSDRIEVIEGDFLDGALGEGFDLALLANLMSVASEESNRALLKRLHARLPAGGAVLLSGWILDDTRTSPILSVLFCLEDIHWGAPDVERTVSRYTSWLAEAGFGDVAERLYLPPWRWLAGWKS